jgi:hypothetical protein
MIMKKALSYRLAPLATAIALTFGTSVSAVAEEADAQSPVTRAELEQKINELESLLDERLGLLADSIDSSEQVPKNRVHIGGYGEMHYNSLTANDEDKRQLDLHRMVLFFGYDFSDNVRFVSEFEVEHTLVSGGSEHGAVEIEQAYVELDVFNDAQFRTGVMLMPIGIVNETHEPPTFYGTERPIIETTIIPSTWYSAGISLSKTFDNGLSYDVLLTEGLKTEDPTTSDDADPFYLKGGKQKASYSDAFDLAVTGRLRYRGITGLELATYGQYQPDLDQSAEESYADSATLLGGHAIYQFGTLTATALFARWDVAGDAAKAAGKDVQQGGYVELSHRQSEKWGVFTRHSAWSEQEDDSATQTDFGVNYYPHPDVVFKADYQLQNDDAESRGDINSGDGFNLGMGYQF